jgi:hypothetical protein
MAATPIPVTDAGGNLSVDDGAGSLTVDNPNDVSTWMVTASADNATATGRRWPVAPL